MPITHEVKIKLVEVYETGDFKVLEYLEINNNGEILEGAITTRDLKVGDDLSNEPEFIQSLAAGFHNELRVAKKAERVQKMRETLDRGPGRWADKDPIQKVKPAVNPVPR